MSASGTTLDADRRTAVGVRLGRLAEAVDRAAERHGPEPRALLLVFGALGVGAGVAAIGLGWYGAAHSPYLFQEIPYVVSGGLLGVALVVAGAALIIGSWVVRLVHEAQHAAGRLDQIADLLARQQPPPAAGAAAPPAAGTMARSSTVAVPDHATAPPAAGAMARSSTVAVPDHATAPPAAGAMARSSTVAVPDHAIAPAPPAPTPAGPPAPSTGAGDA